MVGVQTYSWYINNYVCTLTWPIQHLHTRKKLWLNVKQRSYMELTETITHKIIFSKKYTGKHAESIQCK